MGSVVADVFRWGDSSLHLLDYCELTDATITAADSWLVTDGTSLALDLHRSRFLAAAPGSEEFWDAAIAAIPAEGAWFPGSSSTPTAACCFASAVPPNCAARSL